MPTNTTNFDPRAEVLSLLKRAYALAENAALPEVAAIDECVARISGHGPEAELWRRVMDAEREANRLLAENAVLRGRLLRIRDLAAGALEGGDA